MQVVADQLVVVLGVGDRRLEQLAPVARAPRGREGEDRARLVDATCRGCGRRPGAPCGRRSARTWPGRGRATRRLGRWRRGRACAARLGGGLLGVGLVGAAAARPSPRRASGSVAPRLRPRRRLAAPRLRASSSAASAASLSAPVSSAAAPRCGAAFFAPRALRLQPPAARRPSLGACSACGRGLSASSARRLAGLAPSADPRARRLIAPCP